MNLADFISGDMYRRMADLEAEEQLLVQEVVDAAIRYVAARLPPTDDIREQQALDMAKQLRACKRKLTNIENLVRACDSLSPSESKAVLEAVRRVVSPSV